MAKRIQQRRTKGWRLPPGAICVTRGTKWGNPFVIGQRFAVTYFPFGDQPCNKRVLVSDAARAVELYEAWLDGRIALGGEWHARRTWIIANVHELRGKDLACWCRLDAEWCHADILLRLANPQEAD